MLPTSAFLRSAFTVTLTRSTWALPRAGRVPPRARCFSSQPVSAELVKQLRQRTGAPINKCKQALEAERGDLEAATSWLRKSGIATAQKKAGRGANEGVVGVHASASLDRVAVIELNSETDFVARNDVFQTLARTIAAAALDMPASSAGTTISHLEVPLVLLEKVDFAGRLQSIDEAVVGSVTTLGENLLLRRACIIRSKRGVVAQYVHNSYSPGLGRTAAAVALEAPGASGSTLTAVAELGQKLAMHIVAAAPLYLERADVPALKVEAEAEVIRAQLAETKKPAGVLEKIVQGKLGKFYEDIVLMEQNFALDDSGKVRALVASRAKELGIDITVAGFVRFQLGESSTNQP